MSERLESKGRTGILARIAALLPLVLLLSAFTWPWRVGHPWPDSSERPVAPLAHRALDEAAAELPGGPAAGFRFAAYGDQRALADGEWQALLRPIASRAEADPRLLFILDTGDLVFSGRHSDQFARLADLLAPVAELPYLVAVGNHELKNNAVPAAREYTAACFAYLDPGFGVGRMYYEKRVGRLRLLMLDSNDWVYGEDGEADPEAAGFRPGGRAEAQWRWLKAALAEPEAPGTVTVVGIHHPFVQSSKIHRGSARGLWNRRVDGVSLPELLLDGGVDLVIAGHTHTFEDFRLARGGRSLRLINLSGRPRTAFLWFGDGRRRARDIAGRETERLAEWGWRDLEGWTIQQLDAMLADEANQFAVFDLPAEGAPAYTLHYLDEDAPDGLRTAGPRVLD